MKEVFPQVYMFPALETQNVVFIATKSPVAYSWFKVDEDGSALIRSGRVKLPSFADRMRQFLNQPPPSAATSLILTDDFSPVESLIPGREVSPTGTRRQGGRLDMEMRRHGSRGNNCQGNGKHPFRNMALTIIPPTESLPGRHSIIPPGLRAPAHMLHPAKSSKIGCLPRMAFATVRNGRANRPGCSRSMIFADGLARLLHHIADGAGGLVGAGATLVKMVAHATHRRQRPFHMPNNRKPA